MDQLTSNRPDKDNLFTRPPADLVFDRVEVIIRLEVKYLGFHSPLFNHKQGKWVWVRGNHCVGIRSINPHIRPQSDCIAVRGFV